MEFSYERTGAILLILGFTAIAFSEHSDHSNFVQGESIELPQVIRAPSPSSASTVTSPQPSSAEPSLVTLKNDPIESKKPIRQSGSGKPSRKKKGLTCRCKKYWNRYGYKKRCYCRRKRREPTKVWCSCRRKFIMDGTECFPCPDRKSTRLNSSHWW